MAMIEKKLVKSKSGLRMVTVDEGLTSPFTIEEPQWTPDNDCKHCQNRECQVKFEIFKRKHHCRRCGMCFCDSCCSIQLALPRMCFVDPVRHCKACASITKKENEFFDVHLKILLASGHFRLFIDPNTVEESTGPFPMRAFTCTLSSDHRFLQFDGDADGLEKIMIAKIESVQVAGVELDKFGNRTGKGIAIRHINVEGKSTLFKMEVDNNSIHRHQSMNWVIALLRAFKLRYESQTASPSL